MKNMYLAVLAFCSAIGGGLAFAENQYDPGVSDTEIKIGNTMPYSGPASALGDGWQVGSCVLCHDQ